MNEQTMLIIKTLFEQANIWCKHNKKTRCCDECWNKLWLSIEDNATYRI